MIGNSKYRPLIWQYLTEYGPTDAHTIARRLGIAYQTVVQCFRSLRMQGKIVYGLKYRQLKVLVPFEAVVEPGMCPLCKITYIDHPRCDGCGICVGPKHVERPQDLVDGRCSCCRGRVITYHDISTELREVVTFVPEVARCTSGRHVLYGDEIEGEPCQLCIAEKERRRRRAA